jgi:hypothetical protein
MTNDFQFKNELIHSDVTVMEDGSVVESSSGKTFPSIGVWLEVMQGETQRCAREAALGWDNDDDDDRLLRWQDEVVWFVETTYTFRGSSSVVSCSDGSVRSAYGLVWVSVEEWCCEKLTSCWLRDMCNTA